MIVTPLVVKHLQHKASSTERAKKHSKNVQIARSTYWSGTTWKRKRR